MIDASKGFIKDGNKNRLREQDVHKIVDAFSRGQDIERYCRMVPFSEIGDEKNDYNLNLPRYIDTSDPEDLQDISAHLLGGVPSRDIDALEAYWKVLPGVRGSLFKASTRKGYSDLKVPIPDIKSTIFGHKEFTAFNGSAMALFDDWKGLHAKTLESIKVGDHAKKLIETLSEDLLETYKKAPLLDGYDIYQHLMDFWSETMQDDVYLITQEGWKGVIDGKPNTDLIPPNLLVARYFAGDKRAIEDLEAKRDDLARQLEEMEEEHGGDDGPLNDARNEKGKLTSKSVKDYLKRIKGDKNGAEEQTTLEAYANLIEQEAEASKKVKEATKALDSKVYGKYSALTEADVKSLVVKDKWLARLSADVSGELERVSQSLTGRVRELAERYERPLPALDMRVAKLEPASVPSFPRHLRNSLT